MTQAAMVRRVSDVIDSDIRPGLKIHGGDIAVLAVAGDGQVELEFRGACRGCALQSVTFAVAVRRRLLEVPGLSEVVMRGVRVSPAALERIAELYKEHRFGSQMTREESAQPQVGTGPVRSAAGGCADS